MASAALVTRCHPLTGGKMPGRVRPDPLKVNGNILALRRGKGY